MVNMGFRVESEGITYITILSLFIIELAASNDKRGWRRGGRGGARGIFVLVICMVEKSGQPNPVT